MTKENWYGIYPEHYDGYQLFERLEDGSLVEVTVRGKTYRMQFEGDKYGGSNHLAVTCEGATRWYGRGWESAQVFQALEEMQRGWDREQMYKFRPMEGVTNVEAVG